MAQNTDEMASIVIGDDRDECVTYTPANDHYRQKSPDTVVGSTCGREEHACGHRNRYRRGDGKSTGARDNVTMMDSGPDARASCITRKPILVVSSPISIRWTSVRIMSRRRCQSEFARCGPTAAASSRAVL